MGITFEPTAQAGSDPGADTTVLCGRERIVEPKYPLNPTNNRMVKTQPTFVNSTIEGGDAPTYTGASASVAVNIAQTDAATGLAMATITIPNANTAIHYVEWRPLFKAKRFTLGPKDVLMLSVYIPVRHDEMEIKLITSSDTAAPVLGGNHRFITFSGRTLSQGHNLLTVLNTEEYIDETTFGVVGTTARHFWTDSDPNEHTREVASVRVEVSMNAAVSGASSVSIGALFVAPAGWATAAIMFGVDQIPKSYYELAIPVLERYGWTATINQISNLQYSGANDEANYNDIDELISSGHEMWGHNRRHENLTEGTTAEKKREGSLPPAISGWRGVSLPPPPSCRTLSDRPMRPPYKYLKTAGSCWRQQQSETT